MAAAASLSAHQGLLGTSFYGAWGNSISGDDYHTMLAKTTAPRQQAKVSRKLIRVQPMMKNVNEGKGLFAPLVVVTRDIVGKKRFNQLRGKAIALHSQVCHHSSLVRPLRSLVQKKAESISFVFFFFF